MGEKEPGARMVDEQGMVRGEQCGWNGKTEAPAPSHSGRDEGMHGMWGVVSEVWSVKVGGVQCGRSEK